MKILLTGLLFAAIAAGADNTLSPSEKKDGWKLLFDGRTMTGWQDPGKKVQPGDAWTIEDGCLKTRLKPRIEEDLVSEESFGDFELKFDWRLTPGANTGVKYRIQRLIFVDNSKKQEGSGGFEGMLGREVTNPHSDRTALGRTVTGFVYTVGYEFQLLDDERHPDGKLDASHRTGALYAMIPATAQAAHPAGEWNQSLLVVKSDHFEHWVNGTKVLEGSLRDPRVAEGASHRWKDVPAISEMLTNPKPTAPISLQHHGDEVWFRNIKVHRLQ
jgi:hypothetical protein